MVRYTGNGGIYPVYECNWQRREGLSTRSCVSIRCDLLDGPVVARLLDVVEPRQIEIAIGAFEELERRQNVVDNRWRMKLERARYEADLAQRRYENVDPANRLVAATLERQWNDALARADEIRSEFDAHQATKRAAVTDEQKTALLSLAKDLPSLWGSPATKDKDRKRILRLLIKDITIEKLDGKKAVLHLRWQGGACEDIPITVPPSYYDLVRYPEEVVDRVRVLVHDLPDSQVALQLNKEGIRSAKGTGFTRSVVSWIRYAHKIPAAVLKLPGELTVNEIAEKFGVSLHVVYYWIERKVISARRPHGGAQYYISLDPDKERELAQWVAGSERIPKQGSLNHAAGGAV